MTVVIPVIERRLAAQSGRRMVTGISMGGFNALVVAMKSKGLFTKVASLCSPMPTASHHDGPGEVMASARSSGASIRRAALLWEFSRRYFPTREIWLANDPLALSRSFGPEGGPDLYVSCGKRDEWGCFAGTEQFVANIERAGGTIEWVPRDGGHCDIDHTSLAAFLQTGRTPQGASIDPSILAGEN